MKLEAARSYVQQQRALREQFSEESLVVAPENLEPVNFHERFNKLVDRFYDLPLSEKDRADKYRPTFTIDSPPTSQEDDDSARLHFALFFYGASRTLSMTLYDPREIPSRRFLDVSARLWEERVRVYEDQTDNYSEQDMLHLHGLEQSMTATEQVLVLRGLERVPRLFPVEESVE